MAAHGAVFWGGSVCGVLRSSYLLGAVHTLMELAVLSLLAGSGGLVLAVLLHTVLMGRRHHLPAGLRLHASHHLRAQCVLWPDFSPWESETSADRRGRLHPDRGVHLPAIRTGFASCWTATSSTRTLRLPSHADRVRARVEFGDRPGRHVPLRRDRLIRTLSIQRLAFFLSDESETGSS